MNVLLRQYYVPNDATLGRGCIVHLVPEDPACPGPHGLALYECTIWDSGFIFITALRATATPDFNVLMAHFKLKPHRWKFSTKVTKA